MTGLVDRAEDAPFIFISADSHAAARMADYRAYLDPAFREDFDAFCKEFRIHGSRSYDPSPLLARTDPDEVDRWVEEMIETGRVDGQWDPQRRLREMDREGVSADVLIPDFGLPFELFASGLQEAKEFRQARTIEHVIAGNRAHNRWLVDFCQAAPHRLAGMAVVNFTDIDGAVAEIRWAKAGGLKGVMLPKFDEEVPLFDRKFEPIWSELEELEMPVNCHPGTSSATTRNVLTPPPHPASFLPLYSTVAGFYHKLPLDHFIWGGVLERHSRLRVVFTELGSGWLPAKLASMDYTFSGSYLRRDITEVLRRPPSEYFLEQCFLGSSILSRAEVADRDSIGVGKMMVGTDYPHHEGTWNGGTQHYLQAVFGPEDVPVDEARQMLGLTAAEVFGFDLDALAPVAATCGARPSQILAPPEADLFPRGDVNKPLATTF